MLFTPASLLYSPFSSLCHNQIENLQEQLRDKDKQLGNLKDRVKSLQTDSSNTDTALATLEEALSEKVWCTAEAVERMRRFVGAYFREIIQQAPAGTSYPQPLSQKQM